MFRERRSFGGIILAVAFALPVLPAKAEILAESHFGSTAEGWTGVALKTTAGWPNYDLPLAEKPLYLNGGYEPWDPPSPPHNPGGGGTGDPLDSDVKWDSHESDPTPPGSLMFYEPEGANYNGEAYFKAPSSFLGNKSTAISLSFELKSTPWRKDGGVWGRVDNDTLNYEAIALAGTTKTLWYKPLAGIYPTGSWTSFVASFSPGASWRVGSNPGTSPLAVASDFEDVLNNVTGLYIHADWWSNTYTRGTDAQEFTFLDNVVLFGQDTPTVPEPTSFLSFGMAGLAWMWMASRRRRCE